MVGGKYPSTRVVNFYGKIKEKTNNYLKARDYHIFFLWARVGYFPNHIFLILWKIGLSRIVFPCIPEEISLFVSMTHHKYNHTNIKYTYLLNYVHFYE